MSDGQGELFAAPPPPAPGPPIRVKPCEDAGPYFDYYRTATGAIQYRRLHCTRPPHVGGPHHHATHHGGVLCQWGRDGRPLFPELIGVLLTNGY